MEVYTFEELLSILEPYEVDVKTYKDALDIFRNDQVDVDLIFNEIDMSDIKKLINNSSTSKIKIVKKKILVDLLKKRLQLTISKFEEKSIIDDEIEPNIIFQSPIKSSSFPKSPIPYKSPMIHNNYHPRKLTFEKLSDINGDGVSTNNHEHWQTKKSFINTYNVILFGSCIMLIGFAVKRLTK